MSSTTRTEAGALRIKRSRAACSTGRSLPEIVRELPVPEILTRVPKPFSATASSKRPLYSVAAAERTGTLFAAGTVVAGISGFFSGAEAAGGCAEALVGVLSGGIVGLLAAAAAGAGEVASVAAGCSVTGIEIVEGWIAVGTAGCSGCSDFK